jgi:hypothetical protein
MERIERTDDRPESDDITSSHHGGNRCSEEANADVTPFKSTQRFMCLRLVAQYSPHGISCDEIERVSGLKHQSAGARMTELKSDGLIFRIGYGKTRSGCRCALYVVRDEVMLALKELETEKKG